MERPEQGSYYSSVLDNDMSSSVLNESGVELDRPLWQESPNCQVCEKLFSKVKRVMEHHWYQNPFVLTFLGVSPRGKQ